MNETRQKLYNVMLKAQEAYRTLVAAFNEYKSELHKPLYRAFKKRANEAYCIKADEILGELFDARKHADYAATNLEHVCGELNIRG